MMKILFEIKVILHRLVELLYLSNDIEWALVLKNLEKECIEYPSETVQNILSLYGGMGSFNDLVLYKDGKVLEEENYEFDSLSTKLFDLCVDYKAVFNRMSGAPKNL